jgi:hypothetical protein
VRSATSRAARGTATSVSSVEVSFRVRLGIVVRVDARVLSKREEEEGQARVTKFEVEKA